MPVYDMIEYQIVSLSRGRIPNGFFTRLIYRSIYIVLVAFIGMTLPFFGGKPYTTLPCPTLLCPTLSYALPWHVSAQPQLSPSCDANLLLFCA